ncbi:MAG: dihydroorotate dehydrogenase electron transfer subunit [Draconibacterium sp.]|nr:MAG: dihydroorotate dehydrogenase electron transfer subunit [Draconibacterium sp.]PIF06515.1 MAG: dihydroorotate dehydrogenase electron transfer subunit [Draconibacterium sp.]
MGKKYVRDFKVIENTRLNLTNFRIKLQSEAGLPVMFPGQFANIEVLNSDEVFLRRPFSVFEVDYNQNTISFIIKILGKGSLKLTSLQLNDTVNLIFPLGKGFTLPAKSDKVLLVGGGSGVAPMLFLAKEADLNIEQADIILGARTKDDLVYADHYKKYCKVHYTTEDGSKGEKGLVTQHRLFKQGLAQYNKIYTCGPLPMMKAVAGLAENAGIFCEVSLENLMACGFGVCLCCIEPTTDGNKCVCTDGPVFNINDLEWGI